MGSVSHCIKLDVILVFVRYRAGLGNSELASLLAGNRSLLEEATAAEASSLSWRSQTRSRSQLSQARAPGEEPDWAEHASEAGLLWEEARLSQHEAAQDIDGERLHTLRGISDRILSF